MKRIFAIIAVTLIILPLALGATAGHAKERGAGAQPTVAPKNRNEAVYLLIGVDRASNSADVVMLLRVKGDTLSFLQLPRDSFLAKGTRLNAVFAAAVNREKEKGAADREAYAAGGRALSALLSKGLGVSVSAHAVLTLQGLRTIVDAMGGVTVTLDRAISYEDPVQGVTVSLNTGEQHLDGAAAEGLVRCRSVYPDADYGRMRAQRKLIAAVFDKLKNGVSPKGLLSLFRKAWQEVETDLGFSQALTLLAAVTGRDTALTFATLTGEAFRHNGAIVEGISEVNLEKASAYIGGQFDAASAREIFCYDTETARAIYDSPTPPPFLIADEARNEKG